jgi:hypothetical protein
MTGSTDIQFSVGKGKLENARFCVMGCLTSINLRHILLNSS